MEELNSDATQDLHQRPKKIELTNKLSFLNQLNNEIHLSGRLNLKQCSIYSI